MSDSDVLLTVAELSVAFAGFSSIVVLFQNRQPGQLAPGSAMRLRAMIETSLFTLYAALLPFALEGLGLSGTTLWRVASYCGAALLVASGAVLFQRARKLIPGGELKPAFTILTGVGNLLVVAVVLANALGLFGAPAQGPYVLAAIWGLVIASLAFLRMMTHPFEAPR